MFYKIVKALYVCAKNIVEKREPELAALVVPVAAAPVEAEPKPKNGKGRPFKSDSGRIERIDMRCTSDEKTELLKGLVMYQNRTDKKQSMVDYFLWMNDNALMAAAESISKQPLDISPNQMHIFEN